MKEKYIEPVVEIVKFETEDIITTSMNKLSIGEFPEDDGDWGDIFQ